MFFSDIWLMITSRQFSKLHHILMLVFCFKLFQCILHWIIHKWPCEARLAIHERIILLMGYSVEQTQSGFPCESSLGRLEATVSSSLSVFFALIFATWPSIVYWWPQVVEASLLHMWWRTLHRSHGGWNRECRPGTRSRGLRRQPEPQQEILHPESNSNLKQKE